MNQSMRQMYMTSGSRPTSEDEEKEGGSQPEQQVEEEHQNREHNKGQNSVTEQSKNMGCDSDPSQTPKSHSRPEMHGSPGRKANISTPAVSLWFCVVFWAFAKPTTILKKHQRTHTHNRSALKADTACYCYCYYYYVSTSTSATSAATTITTSTDTDTAPITIIATASTPFKLSVYLIKSADFSVKRKRDSTGKSDGPKSGSPSKRTRKKQRKSTGTGGQDQEEDSKDAG